MNKACIYKFLLTATTFLPAFTFCCTISSFSQEQTRFSPEALILSSCVACTADDPLEHVRSPPEGKYSQQPASQANFTAKTYFKHFKSFRKIHLTCSSHRLWSGLHAFSTNLADWFSCTQNLAIDTAQRCFSLVWNYSQTNQMPENLKTSRIILP